MKDWTNEELEQAIPDPVVSCDEELDESELETVVGGSGNPTPPVTGG